MFVISVLEYVTAFKCLFQVHFVLFSPDIYDVWLNKVDELLKD